MQIVCVGDCGIDHYLPSGERRVGGISANVAIWARRAFGPEDAIRIVAPLGDDAEAGQVRRHLDAAGIDGDFTVLAGKTPVQFIEIDAVGERHFAGYDAGVLGDFRVDLRQLSGADLIVAPVFDQNRAMFASLIDRAAHTAASMLAVDFADFSERPDRQLIAACIDRVDVGFFGLTAGDEDTIGFLRSVAARHATLIVVTQGADGSMAFEGTREFGCRAAPVERVIDTTGAGDAFAAGFLHRYLASRDVGRALSEGALLASRAIRRLGGN